MCLCCCLPPAARTSAHNKARGSCESLPQRQGCVLPCLPPSRNIQVVGPRNKAATARGSKEVAERTPISQLFGGALQSTILTRTRGQGKPSVTQQPMFAVHLEAHHPTLEEAFAALTRPELISGRCGGSTSTKSEGVGGTGRLGCASTRAQGATTPVKGGGTAVCLRCTLRLPGGVFSVVLSVVVGGTSVSAFCRA